MTIENSLERIAKGIEALVEHSKFVKAKLDQPIQFMQVETKVERVPSEGEVYGLKYLKEAEEEEKKKEDELEKSKQLEEIEKEEAKQRHKQKFPDSHEAQVPPPPPAPVKKEEAMTVEQLNDLLIIELERVGEDKNSQINNIIKKHGAPNLTDLDPSKYHLVIEEVGKIASQAQ